MGNSAKRDKRTAQTLRRDTEALRLREQGHTYDAIAKKLGFTQRKGAFFAVKRQLDGLRADCAEVAESVRSLELQRLDRMLVALTKKAEAGDVQAVDRVLRIMERRTAYEGLDVPKQLSVELQRNVLAVLERVKGVVPEDVFDQILLAAAGGNAGTQAPDGTTN